MKTKRAFLVCIIALTLTVGSALAESVLITDNTATNPWQTWGVGSWQNRSQQIVANPDVVLGATGDWLEMGVWGWGGMGIIPRWAGGMWDVFNATQYNNHSQLEMDVLIKSDLWPSTSLAVKFDRDGTGISQVGAPWQVFDVTDAVDDHIYHVVLPYASLTNGFKVTDANADFQGYLSFGTTTGDGLLYIDNLTWTGAPLQDVPEPTTIVMLALAGLMGLLYWRKR
jgi:hypothetical protein